MSFLDFLGIYLLAMFAGVISNVPGGLGVFETVILLILSDKVSAAAVLGSLLAYLWSLLLVTLGFEYLAII